MTSTPVNIIIMVIDMGWYDSMGLDTTRPQGRSWAGINAASDSVDWTNPKFPPTVWGQVQAGNFLIDANGKTLPTGQALLLSNGQVTASVEWRSPYSGDGGIATPIPQSDEFGYFYFSSKANPEVFVKVLDWGTIAPYLLFHGGLTNFEYSITFTEVCSGKKVVLRKPPFTYVGGADSTSLPHSGCVTPYASNGGVSPQGLQTSW